MNNASIGNVIQRIDGWLTGAPVFCSGSGAVAGITRGQEIVYWYGEIAGYYLSYLAGLTTQSSKHEKFAVSAAVRVGTWLQDQWRSEPAPTRIYACETEDWRNDRIFAFDLAMILQGLAVVQRFDAGIWNGRQIAECIKTRLIDERGGLRAVSEDARDKPPDTWSTRIDGYHLKAAASLMAWGKQFEDPLILALGERTVRFLGKDGVSDWPQLPLHPRLYAQEGALRCGLATADAMAVTLNNVFVSTDVATVRTDSAAQLLRLALIARIEGPCVDALVTRLLTSVDADGSVTIHPDPITDERNTWCAIFVRQALFFYLEARLGRRPKVDMCI